MNTHSEDRRTVTGSSLTRVLLLNFFSIYKFDSQSLIDVVCLLKEEEKKNHADEEWKIEKEDDVVDLGTVEEKHDAKWSEDDSKAVDPETRLGGVDESVYLHTIESETVAELEEILVLEKAKIDLKNGIDVIKGRDITLEEAKV